jgi:hypothetical protein
MAILKELLQAPNYAYSTLTLFMCKEQNVERVKSGGKAEG